MQIETPLIERSNLAAGRGGSAALCGAKKVLNMPPAQLLRAQAAIFLIASMLFS
jgi:hypothetical protein